MSDDLKREIAATFVDPMTPNNLTALDNLLTGYSSLREERDELKELLRSWNRWHHTARPLGHDGPKDFDEQVRKALEDR